MLRSSARLWPATRPGPLISPTAFTQRRFAYPKEGVFQPNSPRWSPSTVSSPESYGYGRQPFPGTSLQPAPQPPSEGSDSKHHTPPPPFRARSARILRWTWILAQGLLYYTIFAFTFEEMLDRIPQQFSTPFEVGSEGDIETLKELLLEYSELHEVVLLRPWKLWDTKDNLQKPRFREWPAYNGIPADDGRRSQRLTTGPLAGSGGVAAQAIFVDDLTGAVCCMINFGEGTCSGSPPGIVHNGIVSTIFDETLGRVAINSTEKHTAVTAKLDVHFLNACKPGQWYCIWARPVTAAPNTESKKYVEALMWCTGPYDESKDSPILHEFAKGAPRFEDVIKFAESQLAEPAVLGSAAFLSASNTRAPVEGGPNFHEHAHAYASALFVVPKKVELKGIVEEF